MTTYKVIEMFKDLEDADGYIYKAGEAYPRTGKETSEKRIAELLGSGNKAHKPLIKAIVVADENKEIKPKESKAIKRKTTRAKKS